MIKTVKKSLLFIAITFVFLLVIMPLVCSTSTAYAAEVEEMEVGEEVVEPTKETDWATWFEEKLLPGIIMVVSGVGTVCVAISPILAKVKNGSEKFSQAAANIGKTVENGELNVKKIDEFKSDVENLVGETIKDIIKSVTSLDNRITSIEKAAKNTEEITRIGFCNIDELVTKGYANEIAKVGKDENGEIEE